MKGFINLYDLIRDHRVMEGQITLRQFFSFLLRYQLSVFLFTYLCALYIHSACLLHT